MRTSVGMATTFHLGTSPTVTREGFGRIGPWVASQVDSALFDLHPGVESDVPHGRRGMASGSPWSG